LLQITIDEVAEVESMLESLMGKDSSDRYRMIQENAHRIEVDV
jgi:DNA gyrase/topoisomerase IV subunit B